jgi:hypothetical protein
MNQEREDGLSELTAFGSNSHVMSHPIPQEMADDAR